MLKLFSKYISVGVLNTAIHWIVFYLFYVGAGLTQAMSNAIAFTAAVCFSFYANARYTFNKKATTGRFVIYLAFMGVMAISVGKVGDRLQWNGLVTLVLFSFISLVMGFFYSRYIVFRDAK